MKRTERIGRGASIIAAGLVAAAVSVLAQQPLTEAPTGFDTPTLAQNPGSQSTSNGIPEPAGDSFAQDQAKFELRHDASTGLGPVFNATACAECHQNTVTGAASQITEVRAGHKDANGNFVNPTIPINNGTASISGRSTVNDRAICPEATEHVPATETIHALRAVLNTLGDGFVEAVPDSTLLAIAAAQPRHTHGRIHGETVQVPVFEAPGVMQVGRFGWKDQDPTVLSFVGDAYINEMGVTNRLKPKDTTSVCKVTTALEDPPDANGLANIDHFAQFVRGTKAPPRNSATAGTGPVILGEVIFDVIGCATCHVPSLVTAPAGTVLNGGTYKVSDAIGNKIFHPFGDFLLHDIGTGDGIVQVGPQDTANKLRTVPLWGLRTKTRFMHDLQSLSLPDAIARHQGEATEVKERFDELSDADKQYLLEFLNSL